MQPQVKAREVLVCPSSPHEPLRSHGALLQHPTVGEREALVGDTRQSGEPQAGSGRLQMHHLSTRATVRTPPPLTNHP